jgi:hypothetical protein
VGDLKRHQSTVHDQNSRKHLCPHVACKRHRHGFVRKDNLSEHMKRVHHSGKELATIEDEDCDLLREEDDDEEDDDNEAQKDVLLGKENLEALNTLQEFPSRALLMTKIQELEVVGAKIDKTKAKVEGDIAALKRVLAIL